MGRIQNEIETQKREVEKVEKEAYCAIRGLM